MTDCITISLGQVGTCGALTAGGAETGIPIRSTSKLITIPLTLRYLEGAINTEYPASQTKGPEKAPWLRHDWGGSSGEIWEGEEGTTKLYLLDSWGPVLRSPEKWNSCQRGWAGLGRAPCCSQPLAPFLSIFHGGQELRGLSYNENTLVPTHTFPLLTEKTKNKKTKSCLGTREYKPQDDSFILTNGMSLTPVGLQDLPEMLGCFIVFGYSNVKKKFCFHQEVGTVYMPFWKSSNTIVTADFLN